MANMTKTTTEKNSVNVFSNVRKDQRNNQLDLEEKTY